MEIDAGQRPGDVDRVRRCSWGCPFTGDKIKGRSVGRGRGSFGSRRGTKDCRTKTTKRREWRWIISSSPCAVWVERCCCQSSLCQSVWIQLISAAHREENWSGQRQHQPCLALPWAWTWGLVMQWELPEIFLLSPQPARKIVELTKSDTPPRPGSCSLQGLA